MSATADVHPGQQHVEIAYNGDERSFPFAKDELVSALLKLAISTFGIVNSPHLFGLFTPSMTELSDDATLHDAKVHPNEHLLLRQSEVRGG